MQRRIEWLDFSKFIAIFLMVLCHAGVPYTFDSIVHSFHMPVFFILSGWCFNADKHRDFKSFCSSRFRTLIVPYLFWGVILFAAWEVFYLFFDKSALIPITDFLYYFLYSNAEYSPFCAVQWFLTCMFFAQLIALAVLKVFKSRVIPVVCATVILGALGWILPIILPFRLPLSLDVALPSGAFFLVGWLIPNCINPKMSQMAKKILLNPGILILEVVLGITAACLNGYVNMRLINYNNPLLFYVSALLLSFAVMHLSYFVCSHIKKPLCVYKLTLFFGQNTLAILMLNQVFIQSVKLFVTDLHYVVWFLIAVAVMLIMIPVILLLNKYLPFSVGKTKKL